MVDDTYTLWTELKDLQFETYCYFFLEAIISNVAAKLKDQHVNG